MESINTNFLHEFIIKEAQALGFDDCGISKADFMPEHAQLMEQWLEKDFHGEMSYLERNKEKRYDPRQLVENTRTIITVLQNYFPAETPSEEENYKISKYALGKDYHDVLREKLRRLLQSIETIAGHLEARVFTDSAPALDRAWAEKSGLGFIGKNTCLIHPRKGSFFFVGHIFLPVAIEETRQTVSDYCGTCRRCIDACPTGALVEAHQLDARKCISYLTIEYRGKLPADLKQNFNNYIFGCDICQDVCPWNRFAKPHKEPLFALSEELSNMKKEDWHKLDKEKFKKLFRGSAVERTKYEGLKRNIEFLKDDKE
ncbi:MAG: tRNA epoxyqueuosine(34) reductase QueG [Bacteroidales bacterium]|nr:tRNA epoxyqueuosine(34) reductase QueG [Bacteroidales bacterium]MDP2236543.1 tRNA epoxyqueuosine(34) reductase QueG [Bacteroidales bacterium]